MKRLLWVQPLRGGFGLTRRDLSQWSSIPEEDSGPDLSAKPPTSDLIPVMPRTL
jgi:hypothetical protein